ncbi:hypothetical protein NO134_17030 [Ochrobactrum sp. BD22]|uniref:hypothetical protein n=1 Tax=Ochrobactrum sp. 3-3 TaxID=1830124 RepID=UPI000DEFF93E|nr:hypothetical protein [Ochrobactrum sp. 3-3]
MNINSIPAGFIWSFSVDSFPTGHPDEQLKSKERNCFDPRSGGFMPVEAQTYSRSRMLKNAFPSDFWRRTGPLGLLKVYERHETYSDIWFSRSDKGFLKVWGPGKSR